MLKFDSVNIKNFSAVSGLKSFFLIMALLMCGFSAAAAEEKEGEKEMDVKEIIFEHLGDGYGWEVPFSHTKRMPLPVIVKAQDGTWFTFSSADITELVEEKDEKTGKVHEVRVPRIKEIEKNGKTYYFTLAEEGTHKDKVVQIFPLSAEENAKLNSENGILKNAVEKAEPGAPEIDNYVVLDGKYYSLYRPLDFSITKNVAALFIAVAIVLLMVFGLIGFYRRKGMKAPRKGMGFFEMIVGFVYYDTIKATLGEKTDKFAPYLLSVFFFILVMNIVGLIVIFPGGANLTGNIAVTLVLAVCTFLITNIFGTKHYWKEIFWPDVPIWLKCPIPIMQFIEIFGIFTKPAALCIRLFANMMGGHMIVITLTLLIFIFASFGAAVAGATSVVSVLFSIFMLLLDVLVSFIQAYVFTLLSTIFISLAVVHEEEHHAKEDKGDEAKENEDLKELAEQKQLLADQAAQIDLK